MVVYKTKLEAEEAYRDYIDLHKSYVKEAYEKYGDLIMCILSEYFIYDKKNKDLIANNIMIHDDSKYKEEEFNGYRQKFYPCEEDTKDSDTIEEEFNKAWVHHYMNNPHHPEFWLTPIPVAFLVEMVCDWVAVSIQQKTSIKEWWDDNKEEKITLFTRSFFNYNTVIDLIAKIVSVMDFRLKVDYKIP